MARHARRPRPMLQEQMSDACLARTECLTSGCDANTGDARSVRDRPAYPDRGTSAASTNYFDIFEWRCAMLGGVCTSGKGGRPRTSAAAAPMRTVAGLEEPARWFRGAARCLTFAVPLVAAPLGKEELSMRRSACVATAAAAAFVGLA